MAERLYRSRDDRMIAGVAGGLAEVLDADPSVVRIVWALLIFLTGGLALLVYIVMAIVVPEGEPAIEPAMQDAASATGEATAAGSSGATPPPTRRARRRDPNRQSRGGLIAGLVLISLGAIFMARQLIPAFDFGAWWPILAIGLGIVFVVVAVLPGRRPS